MILRNALIASCLVVSATFGAQSPAKSDVDELVRLILTGDESAAAELSSRGAAVVPVARPHFGSETVKFTAFVRRVINDALERAEREAPGLRFHGQFDHLRSAGSAGANALLAIFLDDDVLLTRRRAAGHALGDAGTRRLLPRLEEIVDDFLIEDWLEREVVFLQARLGDRRRVQKWIDAGQKVADRELTNQTLSATLAAHTELGEIYYRIQEYKNAVRHYQKKLVLLRDLSERVAEELLPAVADEIALVRYNLACSLCLSGDLVQSFVQLKSALTSPTVTLKMIERDGDLARLRKDPQFPKWLAERKSERLKPATGNGQ